MRVVAQKLRRHNQQLDTGLNCVIRNQHATSSKRAHQKRCAQLQGCYTSACAQCAAPTAEATSQGSNNAKPCSPAQCAAQLLQQVRGSNSAALRLCAQCAAQHQSPPSCRSMSAQHVDAESAAHQIQTNKEAAHHVYADTATHSRQHASAAGPYIGLCQTAANMLRQLSSTSGPHPEAPSSHRCCHSWVQA